MPHTHIPAPMGAPLPPAASAGAELERLLYLARAQEAAGQYPGAHAALRQCVPLLPQAAREQTALIRTGLQRTAPLWWANVQHGGLQLRRCQASDAPWVRQWHNDAAFVRQFNRRQPWRGDLARALQRAGTLPPLQTRQLLWIIETRARGPVGLASLSNLDTKNQRAELSLGIPGAVPPVVGVKTMLMMLHYALMLIPLNKVTLYVYEDNPQALHNALHLGFVHEGRLNDHFHFTSQGFVSVDQLGLTRAQLHRTPRLHELARRWIGQDWSPGPGTAPSQAHPPHTPGSRT